MSNVKKGYSKEKKCRDDLKRDGWEIFFKSVRLRFGTIDFALFDIVAAKRKKRKLISVKNYSKFETLPRHQKELKKWKEKYALPEEELELWSWDRPRWKGRGKNKTWHKGGWVKVTI